MPYRGTAVVVLLGVVLAACDVRSEPTPSVVQTGPPQVATAPAELTPVAAHEAETPSVPSPTATAKPTQPAKATQKPAPLPVPPKPTGVKLDYEIEAICGDNPQELCAVGDSIYTVSWKAPRTRGVEMRVYGVTTCFGEDGNRSRIDGHCLRAHTALPASLRVLLAKVPASKGKVTWRMDPGQGLAATRDGVSVHSLVLAAYNAEGGHSIFAIADAGDYCRSSEGACP